MLQLKAAPLPGTPAKNWNRNLGEVSFLLPMHLIRHLLMSQKIKTRLCTIVSGFAHFVPPCNKKISGKYCKRFIFSTSGDNFSAADRNRTGFKRFSQTIDFWAFPGNPHKFNIFFALCMAWLSALRHIHDTLCNTKCNTNLYFGWYNIFKKAPGISGAFGYCFLMYFADTNP